MNIIIKIDVDLIGKPTPERKKRLKNIQKALKIIEENSIEIFDLEQVPGTNVYKLKVDDN